MIISSNRNLVDRVAIVTGATAGIGEALTKDLLFHGVRVVANARREERLAALAEEANAGGVTRLIPVAGSASDTAVVEELFRQAATFGRPADLVVANAGRGLQGSVVTSDLETWDEVFDTNVKAAMLLLRHAGTRMLAEVESEGTLTRPRDIVVLGSCVGRNISPRGAVYSATKFAVHAATEGLRREVATKGIRVSLIEPGLVCTEFHETAGYDDGFYETAAETSGPLIDGEDIARLITFIVSQPPHVHIYDAGIRSVRQEYP